ncbi:CBL-interacting protein kinase 2 [Cryptomeria japonica]|uniref:CBL-interacting protein kinase 2 n=1 Tax=Cryptomeria japonica TaxID=3369 RepID=UPI0025AD8E66|nr:CBL-interacting protein kinase 2 [Cryptomeria japonica]XP_057866960.1 CBL-interacting protein kinase 2 [Cryptomeria japonica]XP_057866962.1 CBL-interacting protein kinase 2 [Cryptomeria japonica]
MAKMQMNGTRMLMGKYELGKLLGQGTFGKVYYAKNTKTGQVVAIKAIDKEKVLKVGMTEQIKREISVMRLVRHPNIVQLFEVMASKTKIYFVMECVKGGELFNKVAKGKLKEDAARKYFQQLISAVDFCHSRGVYHRDLKPENLLLDESGNLKVSDFGLSAVTQQLRQDGLLHTTCGTPAYVAPEVITRKGYDGAKADVWSCGVILFVLMAGYLPFHDPNLMVMYNKICKGEFKCPSWFSYDVRRLLNKLLDPNPKTRITIPQLMEVPWFRKNFKPVHFEIEDDDLVSSSFDEVSSEMSQNSSPDNTPVKKPASLNAFDIISFSRGFDLSRLFEEKNVAKSEKRFTSTQSFSNISSKLEEAAKLLNFNVKKTDCKIKMQGNKNGRKGNLVVATEIFEVTPSFFVVELRKACGDTIEYEKFCNQELKPALKDIVWVWQDDDQ